MKKRVYVCIDVKSFFASVECVERGLDPQKDALVVADPDRGRGALCLAISPFMKTLNVENRSRIYEIPKNIKYILARPRMEKYKEYSKKIYNIYLKYISHEDIYPYSIDECFIDITEYLKLYKTRAKDFVKFLQKEIYKETKMQTSAGVGTNIFLAKVALDIVAKKNKESISYLTEDTFEKYISYHRPLRDIWGIGKSSEEKLNNLGIYDLKTLSKFDKIKLKNEFGVNAEKLIMRSKGQDNTTIKELIEHIPINKSYSISKTFFNDHNYYETYEFAKIILEKLVLKVFAKNYYIGGISLKINYSKEIIKSTRMDKKLLDMTNLYSTILKEFTKIYEKIANKEVPIRQIYIRLYDIKKEKIIQYSLFENYNIYQKEESILKVMVDIKNKYGDKYIMRLNSINNIENF